MSTFHILHFVQGNNEYDYYPQVDNTLSVEGRAADAKKTGDEISDLKSAIEVAPESPDTDGVYIMQRENGLNSYVALASSATIQDIISRLEALEGSGT